MGNEFPGVINLVFMFFWPLTVAKGYLLFLLGSKDFCVQPQTQLKNELFAAIDQCADTHRKMVFISS